MRKAMPKLSQALIIDICEQVEAGLNNKEACEVNDVTDSAMYKWIRNAEKALEKPQSQRTDHQKLCVKFFQSLKKSRHKRKRKRIQSLQQINTANGLIFLLKNEYPREFNRRPHLIPNFEKLEDYMASEYTQAEINAIREAIFAAEDRRESEVEYDENAAFTQDGEGDN